jgi:type I restriction enzyme S subunit
LERLEVSEATFSEIAVDNEKFRIDDEFFQKKYINAYRKVKSIKHTTLNEELECLTDFHSNGSYETIAQEFDLLDAPDYAYMVRTTDLEMQNYNDDVKYVTKSAYNFLSKSKVYGGEVLINKIGTPGKSYLMPKLNRPVSLGMNLFMLRLKQDSKLTEPYLWTFLNTELGKNIISRKINGTVPLTIDKEAVKSLYIPVISNDCQKKIGNIVLSSQNKLKEAKELYAQAQNILLEATDLKGFNSSKENKAIKNFKESFLTTGRLDAEYYQPKYEEIISKIKQGEYDFLGNLESIKKSI